MRAAAIILIAFALAILAVPIASAHPVATHRNATTTDTILSDSPVLFGKPTASGILIGLYYQPPLGSMQIIHSRSLVPADRISYAIYNPGPSATLNLTVEQYLLQQQNITTRTANTTTTRTIFVQVQQQYANVSVLAPSKTIVQGNITLPIAAKKMYMQISYDGAVFQFYHQSAPAALPAILTQGGELEIWGTAFALGSLIWILGAITARSIIDRVKYWPKRSVSGWVVILIAMGFVVFFFVSTYYYDLGYIPWYAWLIPLYYVASAFMLGIFRPEIKRWELFRIYGEKKDEKILTDIRAIYVAPDAELGWQKISLHSRREAIARLFGRKIPVTFLPGPPAWYAGNEYWEDPIYDTERTYFLDPKTSESAIGYSYLEKKMPNPLRFIPRIPDTVTAVKRSYRIPLSGHYSKRIAEFLGQLFSASRIGKALEDAQWKIEELNGRLELRHSEFNRAQMAARAAASHGLTEEYAGARSMFEAREKPDAHSEQGGQENGT